MKNFPFLITLLILALVITAYKPTPKFCKLKCGDEKNIACECGVRGGRKEDLSDLYKFRKHILNVHNDIRNSLASGTSTEISVNSSKTWYYFSSPVSNMYVLSYDLELEYVARCYAVQHVFHRDRCRRTSKFENPGQFIARFEKKPRIEEIAQFIYDTL